ncbi:hypothetical protein QO002_005662 [Pararhizobium capsulatum DSM 1112]|uniref:Transposase n=1 Tax=Pararhizobium capsulatum DSM 1112 TaxID=1121113 RepID=A0ABU0BYW7_9HYPH|nr:hypothetical protein [Pararhizobium capsulatum DSM 1112]
MDHLHSPQLSDIVRRQISVSPLSVPSPLPSIERDERYQGHSPCDAQASLDDNLKEVVAEQALELRLLKKSMIGLGGDEE